MPPSAAARPASRERWDPAGPLGAAFTFFRFWPKKGERRKKVPPRPPTPRSAGLPSGGSIALHPTRAQNSRKGRESVNKGIPVGKPWMAVLRGEVLRLDCCGAYVQQGQRPAEL